MKFKFIILIALFFIFTSCSNNNLTWNGIPIKFTNKVNLNVIKENKNVISIKTEENSTYGFDLVFNNLNTSGKNGEVSIGLVEGKIDSITLVYKNECAQANELMNTLEKCPYRISNYESEFFSKFNNKLETKEFNHETNSFSDKYNYCIQKNIGLQTQKFIAIPNGFISFQIYKEEKCL